MTQHTKTKVTIRGMHCASCELLVERRIKKIPGVDSVESDHVTGTAVITSSHAPSIASLNRALHNTEYRIADQTSQEKPDYGEIAALFGIILIVYYLLNELHLVPQIGVTGSMSYGFVFLIGLVAAMSSCIAVTGGLLLSVVARYNDQHPGLDEWAKFKPHIYFNAGRIVSYTMCGALIGAVGSAFTLSPSINGLITIIASIVMVLLGFQMLHVFPGLWKFQPKMPKFLGHTIHSMSESHAAPFLLGASTFFLPCGFTQALQLYVLGRGNWQVGALTMLVFSLGTLPALMSLSALSSLSRGMVRHYFIRIAAVIVVLLGIYNVSNGLALIGIRIPPNLIQGTAPSRETLPPIVNGKQVVSMTLVGYDYSPHQVTVRQGIPVEWKLDGRNAEGCAQVVTMPKLGITETLPRDRIKTITFVPQEPGPLFFNCPMGMTTRGASFIVVPNR